MVFTVEREVELQRKRERQSVRLKKIRTKTGDDEREIRDSWGS